MSCREMSKIKSWFEQAAIIMDRKICPIQAICAALSHFRISNDEDAITMCMWAPIFDLIFVMTKCVPILKWMGPKVEKVPSRDHFYWHYRWWYLCPTSVALIFKQTNIIMVNLIIKWGAAKKRPFFKLEEQKQTRGRVGQNLISHQWFVLFLQCQDDSEFATNLKKNKIKSSICSIFCHRAVSIWY